MAALVAVLAAAAPARAAELTVVGFTDTTPGVACDATACASIRAALVTAARLPGPDTIEVPAGTQSITNGPLRIASEVNVVGESARTTVLSGDTKSSRVVDVDPGTVAMLSSLTVSHGTADDEDPPYGGGVLNRGTLLLDHVRVTGNRAPLGGGVANYEGVLTVRHTLIDHNSAWSAAGAGGLLNLGGDAGASVTVSDSTVAFNTGALAGGIRAVGNGGNSTTLERVTVARNIGTRGYGGIAIAPDGGRFGVQATIVADNSGILGDDCGGSAPRDDGANVESGTDCGFTSGSDRQDADPGLSGSLVDAGGETDVLTIPWSSVAIDLAPPCPNVTDQRGIQRAQGLGCDAGAYEVEQAPETQIDSGPSGTIANAAPAFTFSSPAPNASFECRLDGPGSIIGSYAACGSPRDYAGLADGTYTFLVRATDGDLADATPATRTFTIDATPPHTSIGFGPTGLTNNASPSLTFGSTEAGSTFECRLDGPGASTGAYAPCTSPEAYSGLRDGAYTFLVFAIDAAGNADPMPASRSFTVDATPPEIELDKGPSGVTTKTSTTFEFSSTKAATTFACRLDGPAAGTGQLGPCASPLSFSGLAPGDYTFFVRATDAAGNQSATSRSFTVALAPTPTPTPTATLSQAPTPIPGQTVVLQRVRGKVRVREPGSRKFIAIGAAQAIPLRSTIDTRAGTVELAAALVAETAPQKAKFFGGMFKVTQSASTTNLSLNERLARCTRHSASASARKRRTRKLWGNGSGSFRTRGHYSSATVRGTKWLVKDSCGKTVARVARGLVAVRDFVKHKTVLVRAPRSYTARSRR